MDTNDVKEDRPPPERDQIDISQEASDFEIYSLGELEDLESLDKRKRIQAHWFRERTIVLLAASIIAAVLCAALSTLIWSSEDGTRDWARQSLTALLGFGAGAIFSNGATKSD